MLSHLPRSLNLTFDNIFRDDVSVDSFFMSFGVEQEIVLQPVLIRKKTYSTKIGNTKWWPIVWNWEFRYFQY